ncbi:MAG: ATP-binding protein [Candidatus Aquicultorales bacterium]
MLAKRIRLSLPAKSQNLTLIRQLIDKFIGGTPFEDRSYEIQLVMSEACSNVIRHAYDKKHSSSLVTIHGRVNPFVLTISVQDTGKGLTGRKEDIAFPGDGGYGLALMRTLCDRFSLHTTPGVGTTVNLTFNRRLVRTSSKYKKAVVAWAAAAAVLGTGVGMNNLLSMSKPGSVLYPARGFSESVVLGLPMVPEWKVDMATAFAERHLDDFEDLYDRGEYDAMDRPLESVAAQIETINNQLRKLESADRLRYGAKLKNVYDRLILYSERALYDGDADGRARRVLADVLERTGEILAEPAVAGERI